MWDYQCLMDFSVLVTRYAVRLMEGKLLRFYGTLTLFVVRLPELNDEVDS